VLIQRPADPKTNLLMAELCVARKEYSCAAPFLEKSSKVPTELQPRVHALLGQVYAASDRIPEAIGEMKQGLSMDDDGSLHYQLARLYQKTGEKTSAAQLMQQVKALQESQRERATMAIRNAATVEEVDNALR
jgi:hypothetical protein